MNVGMELNHNETFLETAIDNEKVVDIAAKFDGERVMKQMSDFMKNRKERQEENRKNRKVKNIGGLFGLLKSEKDDTDDYYTSYDEHLKLLNDEIENQKAEIERGLYRLKLLGIKEKNIIDEKNTVTSENFQLPDYLKFDGFEDLMKEHIFRKHPKLIGDYWGDYRFTSKAGKLNVRPVYNKDGKMVKLLCLDCYFKFLEKNGFTVGIPTKDDGELELHDKIGSK